MSSVRRSIIVVSAVGSLVSMGMAAAPAASGSTSGTGLQPPSGNVVTFDQPVPLKNTVTKTIQGTRVSDGCSYQGSAEVPPGGDEVAIHETSENTSTCTMTVVRGTPTSTSAETSDPSDASTSGQAAADPAEPSAVSPAATTHSKGYVHAWYQDPAHIHLTSVTDHVNWRWNGHHVSHGHCSYHYTWHSSTGWGLKGNNFYCRYEKGKTRVDSSSYAHFKDGIFCVFTDTDTYFKRVHAYGKSSGGLVGTWHAHKSGHCAGLLSFHAHIKRTYH